MKFAVLLRDALHYRREAFVAGMRALGYTQAEPHDADVLVIWNRYGHAAALAEQCEARGGTVLVAENASWGNGFAGERWYTLARGIHNTAGKFPVGGPDRWDSLGITLEPWRPEGGEIVGLLQRGIGPAGTAMPRGWYPPGCTRIRRHPGKDEGIPLDIDLANASEVRTWGSGAAVKALMQGIRVRSWMPNWIAEQDNTDAGRLAMFRRLAWAQWRLGEIESGEAMAWLLS
jgi:hypothetical protein